MMSSNNPSLFRSPRISMRWLPVFRRNLLVWRKLAIPSLVGNIAEPLITLVAFGYGLGALVGQVQLNGSAVPYILFLASGSICMSAMNAASFEALYSAFSRMQVQRTWDGIMNAPVQLDDVVFAEMLWAAFKSLFTTTVILLVMLALNISRSPMLLLALPLLGLVGITFSCIALIFNALAKGYDFFTYYFTLFLTPTMFLSGVFFPRDQLPGIMRVISDWLPLTAAVELIRPLFLGQWPAHGLQHLLLLVIYAVVAVAALSVLGSSGLASAPAPLADAVAAAGAPQWQPVVRAGAAVAALGSLLALILGVSRTTLAMARDHHLPHALAAVHPRFAVPHRAEVLVGIVVAIMAAVVDLRGAIGFSSFAVLLYYAIANAAAWTLGRRVIPALGLAGCLVLAFSLPLTSVLTGLAVVTLGAVIYGVRRR